jgi:hypothetical protein
MTIHSLRLPALALLLSVGMHGVAAPAAAQADATGAGGIKVQCVRVLDRHAPSAGADADAAAALGITAERAADSCARKLPGHLVGTGDVEVGLSAASYGFMRDYEARNEAQHPSLYVNGVLLSKDARLVSLRQYPETVFMRYNIVPGDQSKILWSALYRTGATAQPHALGAAIGFEHGPMSDTMAASPVDIAITSPGAYHAGILLVCALVVAGLVLGHASDIFRAGSLPPPLQQAAAMKLRAAREKIPEDAAVLALDPAYTAGQRQAYAAAAQSVLDGADPAPIAPARLAAGLYLLRGQWRTLKSAYSLSRVQLGLWTLFAVAAGAYLWVIYGDLPDIDGTLLVLLGLSAATTTLSLAADQDNPNLRFSLSQGFLTDLVTGWDDKQQLHRFQAVIVNVLLLIVGVTHVYTHLTYPIFSPNWLTLLGISGLALAAGKKYVEGQVQPAATRAAPAAPAAQVAGQPPLGATSAAPVTPVTPVTSGTPAGGTRV